MAQTKQQLKESIPLYSDLAEYVLKFLEPCLDYDVPKCTHEIAFCQCGNTFEFHSIWFAKNCPKVLLEKFCPFCGTANPHKTKIPEFEQLEDGRSFPFLVRSKKYLVCSYCEKHAESYDHKFCSACQHKLKCTLQLSKW